MVINMAGIVGRMMNACKPLGVPGVRSLIFSSLPAQDCSKLAQTCAAFYEQAMNAVWADVKSLIPFLLCMPSETLSLETKKCRLPCGNKAEIVGLRMFP